MITTEPIVLEIHCGIIMLLQWKLYSQTKALLFLGWLYFHEHREGVPPRLLVFDEKKQNKKKNKVTRIFLLAAQIIIYLFLKVCIFIRMCPGQILFNLFCPAHGELTEFIALSFLLMYI